MNMLTAESRAKRILNCSRSSGGPAILLLAALVAGTGCEDTLSVDTPDIVRPENLNTPAGLAAFRAGAYGDFVRAFSGEGDDTAPSGHVQLGCLFTDECHSTNTQGDDNQTDARRTTDTNGDLSAYYTDLHRARFAMESTIGRYENAAEVDEREEAIAEMQSLAGYTYIQFAESFCSGVPFSTSEGATITFGQPETTQQVLDRALDHFDAAIATATAAGLDELEYLARVGKARVLLNLADYEQAAQVVAPVPTDFLYTVKYSTNTASQENGIRGVINVQQRNSATTNKGATGLDYFGAFDSGDPRTPYEEAGRGFDETDHFRQLKYPLADSPVPLASGVEARLAEAEAHLDVADIDAFQTVHDDLRASIGLGSVDVVGMTEEERVRFHFQERAFWTWLEGKRLGDLRRLVRNYGLDSESVYPTGAYLRPHYPTFGDLVNFPVPRIERDNPNFTEACLSEAA
jgi:hypothetical protein